MQIYKKADTITGSDVVVGTAKLTDGEYVIVEEEKTDNEKIIGLLKKIHKDLQDLLAK